MVEQDKMADQQIDDQSIHADEPKMFDWVHRKENGYHNKM